MSKAVIYEINTGRIARVVQAPSGQLQCQCGDGEAFLIGEADDSTVYVAQGELVARPVMQLSVDKAAIAANGVDCATVSGIPAGADVSIDFVTYPVTDQTLSVTTTMPGEMHLLFTKFPYIDAEVIINAT